MRLNLKSTVLLLLGLGSLHASLLGSLRAAPASHAWSSSVDWNAELAGLVDEGVTDCILVNQDGSILATTGRKFLNDEEKSTFLQLANLDVFKGTSTNHAINGDRYLIQWGDLNGYLTKAIINGRTSESVGYVLNRFSGESNDRGFVIGFYDSQEKFNSISRVIQDYAPYY